MPPINQGDIALFGLALFFVLLGLFVYFYLSYWDLIGKKGMSPYTGMPLRSGRELTYLMKDRVRHFLRTQGGSENRPFDFGRAALCRETGRLFPDCTNVFGTIKLDWGFINQKVRGHFVSWGSLSEEMKSEVRKAHTSLDGFQVEFSSKNPSPRMVDESYALLKPGPLYVDPDTFWLIGWKNVPETDLEVLVVQKPITIHVVKPRHG